MQLTYFKMVTYGLSCALSTRRAVAFPRYMRYTRDVAPVTRADRGVRETAVFGVILIIAVAAQGWAGVIQPGAVTVEEWECQVPLLLSGGENQVAALDFHLAFDPAVFTPVAVEPGPAALRAGKMVTANAAEPGRYIVVVLGLNQTPLEDGLVALVLLRRRGGEDGATTMVAVQQPTLASWEGKALPAEGGAVAVSLPERPETTEGEGEAEGETPEEPSTPEQPSDGSQPGRAPTPMTTLAGERPSEKPPAQKEPKDPVTESPVGGTKEADIPPTSAELRNAVEILRQQAGDGPLAGGGVPETGPDDTAETTAAGVGTDTGRAEDAPRSLTIEQRAIGETVNNSTLSREAEAPAPGRGASFRGPRGVLIAVGLAAAAALLLVLRFRLFR